MHDDDHLSVPPLAAGSAAQPSTAAEPLESTWRQSGPPVLDPNIWYCRRCAWFEGVPYRYAMKPWAVCDECGVGLDPEEVKVVLTRFHAAKADEPATGTGKKRIDSIAMELKGIKAAVEDLGDAGYGVRATPRPASAVVSKREAARILGVDRSTTLEDLIRTRALPTVTIGGRVKIPRSEIKRIAQEGTQPRVSAKRQRRSAVAANVAEEISSIDIDELEDS